MVVAAEPANKVPSGSEGCRSVSTSAGKRGRDGWNRVLFVLCLLYHAVCSRLGIFCLKCCFHSKVDSVCWVLSSRHGNGNGGVLY